METHLLIITYHECATRYGLSAADIQEFVDLGLLHPATHTPDAVEEEPEQLARLARLHHELGLSKDSLEVVMAMRQRLQRLQQELMQQRARVRQLEAFLGGTGPVLDVEFR